MRSRERETGKGRRRSGRKVGLKDTQRERETERDEKGTKERKTETARDGTRESKLTLHYLSGVLAP